MAFTLERVVPWGRSLDEYRRMFALTEFDLRRRILGCGDGPASFNAELSARGGSAVSFDPIYAFSVEEIRGRIEATYPGMIERARQNRDDFLWTTDVPDPEALGDHRIVTMERFLADFPAGQLAGRYVTAELPALPFVDGAFDLALCSHLLFLYSEQLSGPFHVESLRSLLRVASEVRVFPLLDLGGRPSRHLHRAMSALRSDGYRVVVEAVKYEFRRGANQMLRISR